MKGKIFVFFSMVLTLVNSFPSERFSEREPTSSPNSSPFIVPSERLADSNQATDLKPQEFIPNQTIISIEKSTVTDAFPLHDTLRKQLVRTHGTRMRRTPQKAVNLPSGEESHDASDSSPWAHDLLNSDDSNQMNPFEESEEREESMISWLDDDQIRGLLIQLEQDPESVMEVMGLREGNKMMSDNLQSTRSRNSRNRLSNEQSLWQKMSHAYHSNIKQTALKMKRGEGPQLSVVSPLDVLRQQLIYELARRRIKESRDQIQVNEQLLKSLGKRSISREEEMAFFNPDPVQSNSQTPSQR